MSTLFGIRCYIDCDEFQLCEIKSIIDALGASNTLGIDNDRALLYRGGWCFQQHSMNGMQHAFYGGSVREDGISLFLDDLGRIANALPEIGGLVVIDGDDESVHEEIRIEKGGLIKVVP